mgnify:FL=1
MSKVLKIVKFLTVFVFLITLLSVYAFLPKEVSLFINDMTVEKQTFFYGVLILFCLLNFLFSSLSWFYKRIKESDPKKKHLKEWTVSLPVPINGCLIFIVAYIGIMNNADSVNPSSYAYLLYLGPLLLVIWIAAVFKILFQSPKAVA